MIPIDPKDAGRWPTPQESMADLERETAPGPTRLDPPIEIPIVVSVNRDPSARRRALRHLNVVREWPDGIAPPEVQETPQHRAAVAMLLGSHELRVLVTHIDVEGRLTFELARDA